MTPPVALPRPTTLADDLREVAMLAAGVVGTAAFFMAAGAGLFCFGVLVS